MCHNFIIVLCNAYLEYTQVEWIDHVVYRRTVDLNAVVWC